MDRRTLLKTSAALPVFVASSRLGGFAASARADERRFDPQPGPWRTYEIATRIDIVKPTGTTRVWLPFPVVRSDFQQPLEPTWSGNAKVTRPIDDQGVGMLYAEFAETETAPTVELTTRVQTRDRRVDWSKKTRAAAERRADLAQWTRSTNLLPTDGIVRATALEITRGARTDLEKTRAVYDWVVTNTYRELSVRGCGTGDIRRMLDGKNLGGKCGDLNGLFVGLLRAAGVPARDVYGIRVAPSAFGYKALGAASATVTKAQHCRAEVFLEGHGWVAMDPADVAKVAREETGEWMTVDDPIVDTVRGGLFGSWEGNWIAFNTAHDVVLPNASDRAPLGFFMYPQAETGAGRRDCLDPDNFKYAITARAI